MGAIVYVLKWQIQPLLLSEGDSPFIRLLYFLFVVFTAALTYFIVLLVSKGIQKHEMENIPKIGPFLAEWLTRRGIYHP